MRYRSILGALAFGSFLFHAVANSAPAQRSTLANLLVSHTPFTKEKEGTHVKIALGEFFRISTNALRNGRNFTPYAADYLCVREAGACNVNSLWFNVVAPASASYRSLMRVGAQDKQYHTILSVQANFGGRERNWWLSAFFDYTQRCTMVWPEESDIATPGTLQGFATMRQALTSSVQGVNQMGKENCWHGANQMLVRLGRHCAIGGIDMQLYTSCLASFYSARKPVSLFPARSDPLVAFGGGLNATVPLTQSFSCIGMVDWLISAAYTSWRLLDLSHRPWSHYLQTVSLAMPYASRPAGDDFLASVCVRPTNQVQAGGLLMWHTPRVSCRAGYIAWWEQADHFCVKMVPAIEQRRTIFDLSGAACCSATSAITASIDQGVTGTTMALSDYYATPLTEKDFSAQPGSDTSALSQTFFFALDLPLSVARNPVLLQGIAYYELGSPRHRSCSYFGGWLAAQLAF